MMGEEAIAWACVVDELHDVSAADEDKEQKSNPKGAHAVGTARHAK